MMALKEKALLQNILSFLRNTPEILSVTTCSSLPYINFKTSDIYQNVYYFFRFFIIHRNPIDFPQFITNVNKTYRRQRGVSKVQLCIIQKVPLTSSFFLPCSSALSSNLKEGTSGEHNNSYCPHRFEMVGLLTSPPSS